MAVNAKATKEVIYNWEGKDKKGKIVKGEMRASGDSFVSATLRRQGITVTKVKKQSGFKSGGSVSDKDVTLFTRQLATMMKSGVPIVQSLEIIGSGHKNPRMKKMIDGSTTTTDTTTTVSSCALIPEETAGPYPGDGTNTANGSVVNVLTQSGVLRSDIRSSFGTLSGTAGGVPLTVALKLVNSANSCANLTGYAVYLWHCTREGEYSLYAATLGNQNYLRGVQVSDSSGLVSFTTIFPGCYSGRWPHIHFEVYQSLALATSGSACSSLAACELSGTRCSRPAFMRSPGTVQTPAWWRLGQ